ncbi:Rossmann-like alpha/beta/alpha sandwich fold protein [Ophiocordyceps sinensis CO18]|uniref:FAD synthase n=1 Tax=Ophiocordyceps sinensis (strain Co18 / CGMCC 3.14243) TaxID=911162 RepID=T4ZZJ2_OPHSC|nr:Rossmann-like alpha/beta/alpha sandwich fold protein [Ophiocordyceps sinensis CO18]
MPRNRGNELSLSYNGGKDCLVLLILILACLPDPTQLLPAPDHDLVAEAPTESPIEPLQAIYIAPPDPFPEVEDFVAVSTSHYHLDLTRYALPMRDALEAYRADRPPVKAIFMGTRRTDPHSEFLTPFSPTDGDWPRFMRVNPVLDWHYPEIWAVSCPGPFPVLAADKASAEEASDTCVSQFIRHLDIPFCSLYNRGFTSLGGTRNTRPNPSLALDDGGGAKAFRPAYELVRDDEERLGRDR